MDPAGFGADAVTGGGGDLERSRLPPSLVAAYRATRYEVTAASPPFELRVDETSVALATCHRVHDVRCSAFVTAWNPGSRQAAAAVNSAAGAALEQRLRARGYRLLAGRGVDPAGRWPVEDSVLVLGLERDAACEIARQFGQAGLVCAGDDAVPRLVLLA
jgi:Protein of unknown function (DUF3293)